METYFFEYFQDLECAVNRINLDSLKKINNLLFMALKEGRQIFTMGNGGSGSTASHFVCDLNKGVCLDHGKRFKAICLNDNVPTLLAYANDMSYSDIFCESLKNFMQEEDIVIGFSGSGNSKNVIKAIEYANENGGVTIGFSGFSGGKLSKVTTIPLVVPVNDMQKCEDLHLILCHFIMQRINNMLKVKWQQDLFAETIKLRDIRQ